MRQWKEEGEEEERGRRVHFGLPELEPMDIDEEEGNGEVMVVRQLNFGGFRPPRLLNEHVNGFSFESGE